MRIVIDIDGTISGLRKKGQTYENVRINEGAAEKIRALKEDGHYIILYSARHMKTCNGDVELVKKKVGKITEDWLKRHNVPYDELHFGKPFADIYIDDLGYTFKGWDKLDHTSLREKKLNILVLLADKHSSIAQFEKETASRIIGLFDMLDNVPAYQWLFVISQQQEKVYGASKKLKKFFSKHAEVIVKIASKKDLYNPSMLVKEHIDNNNMLCIYDHDDFEKVSLWKTIQGENPEGILACFRTSKPKHTYVELDEYGYASHITTKKSASNLAAAGIYYFKKGSDFVSSANHILSARKKGNEKLDIATCYNELIKIGKRIMVN